MDSVRPCSVPALPIPSYGCFYGLRTVPACGGSVKRPDRLENCPLDATSPDGGPGSTELQCRLRQTQWNSAGIAAIAAVFPADPAGGLHCRSRHQAALAALSADSDTADPGHQAALAALSPDPAGGLHCRSLPPGGAGGTLTRLRYCRSRPPGSAGGTLSRLR